MVENPTDKQERFKQYLEDGVEELHEKAMESVGRLLLAQSSEDAMNAVYEYIYWTIVAGKMDLRIAELSQVSYSDHIGHSLDTMTARVKKGSHLVIVGLPEFIDYVPDVVYEETAQAIEAPEWSTFKQAAGTSMLVQYRDLVSENGTFDLGARYKIPSDFSVDGVQILKSNSDTEITIKIQKFNSILQKKLDLIPDEFSGWVYSGTQNMNLRQLD